MSDIFLRNKKVGKIVNGDTYWTWRNSTEHFFRKRQGYPIAVEILQKLKDSGIRNIIIEEIRQDGTHHLYQCFVSDYDFIESFQEEGFEEQKCIPLRRMARL